MQQIFNLNFSLLGHGGLALNPTSSARKSQLSEASNSGKDQDKANAADASSMLVMSGGEGYIDFRIGKRNIFVLGNHFVKPLHTRISVIET